MRILVACEFSGVVREAFRKRGHDAYSCDFTSAEDGSKKHHQCDVRDLLSKKWDLMVAHPPCTYLAVSGARWWSRPGVREKQLEALRFVMLLYEAKIPKIAIENPVGKVTSLLRSPTQIIQPWMFGHGETKATCLWLRGIPKLIPTNVVDGRESRIHRMPPSPNRQRERSRTYQGIADAMAAQWG